MQFDFQVKMKLNLEAFNTIPSLDMYLIHINTTRYALCYRRNSS